MEETRHSLLGYLAIDRLRAAHEELRSDVVRLRGSDTPNDVAGCVERFHQLAADVRCSVQRVDAARTNRAEPGSVAVALESSANALLEAADVVSEDFSSAEVQLEKSFTLIRKALEGAWAPDRTWDALFKLYPPLIHRWLSGWPSTRAIPSSEYDDIASEVMIAFLAVLPTWERQNAGGTRTWLKTVTHRRAMDYFRKQKKFGAVLPDDVDIEALSDRVDPEEEKFYADRYIRAVKSFLTGPDLVIVERFLEGSTQVETAKELGLSEGAVKNRWMRLKVRLRNELGDLPDCL